MEQLCTAGVAVAFSMGTPVGFGAVPIMGLGTEAQKKRHLPKIVEAKEKWSMALTEPGGGTDILGAIKTTAVKQGDEYVINGSKMFISGAHVADYITTIAITDIDADRKKGLSIFIVDAKSPGLTINLIKLNQNITPFFNKMSS